MCDCVGMTLCVILRLLKACYFFVHYSVYDVVLSYVHQWLNVYVFLCLCLVFVHVFVCMCVLVCRYE